MSGWWDPRGPRWGAGSWGYGQSAQRQWHAWQMTNGRWQRNSLKQERFQQELQQVAQEGALTPTPGVAAFGAPRGDPQAGAGVPPDEHAVSPTVWASVQEKRQIAGTLKQLHTLQSGIVDPGDRAALAGLITKYQEQG